MSLEEDVSESSCTEAEDIANDFKHPKLQDEFIFRKTIPEFTTEENGRDVSVAVTVATRPATERNASTLFLEITRENGIYYIASPVLDQDGFLALIENLLSILDSVTTNRTSFWALFTGTSLEFRQQLEFENVK
jgi:hypothetical protein